MRDALKTQRNADLARMLMNIASWVHYTEAEDIVRDSTSMESIWKSLQEHYNIAAKGSDFLKITRVIHNNGMLASTYYKEYRGTFIDNMRKKGSSMGIRKGGAPFLKDEKLTPSFKDVIVMWALEKIDPRLLKVRRVYDHRLGENSTFSTFSAKIFQAVPIMIEEMDKQTKLRAMLQPEPVHLDAFGPSGSAGVRNSQDNCNNLSV